MDSGGDASASTLVIYISQKLAATAWVQRWLILPAILAAQSHLPIKERGCSNSINRRGGILGAKCPLNGGKNVSRVFSENREINTCPCVIFGWRRRPAYWPLSSDTLWNCYLRLSRASALAPPTCSSEWTIEFGNFTLIGRRWLLSERLLKTRLVTLDWRLLLPRQPYLMR